MKFFGSLFFVYLWLLGSGWPFPTPNLGCSQPLFFWVSFLGLSFSSPSGTQCLFHLLDGVPCHISFVHSFFFLIFWLNYFQLSLSLFILFELICWHPSSEFFTSLFVFFSSMICFVHFNIFFLCWNCSCFVLLTSVSIFVIVVLNFLWGKSLPILSLLREKSEKL